MKFRLPVRPALCLAAFIHCVAASTASAQVFVSITASNVSCYGLQNGSATAVATGGNGAYAYAWSNAQSTATIQNLTPGTYQVTVSDGTGATATSITVISQPPQLGVITFGTDQICDVAPDGTATAVPYGGTPPYAYAWNNGAVTAQITQLVAGNYTVTVTDAHGCEAVDICTVTSFGEGVWVSAESTNATCAGGGHDGTAHASPMTGTPPYTFLWSNGATTQDISGLAPGIYSVQVTDANGCANLFGSSVTITLIPGFSITPVVTPETCYNAADGSISLTLLNGQPPYDIQWSNGANGATLQNLSSGVYSVTISDGTGCLQTEAFTVGLGWPNSCGDTLTAVIDSCQNCPFVIPDVSTNELQIFVQCATDNDLSHPLQGLCGVHLRFGHEFLGDLRMTLRSPSGQTVQLVGPTGSSFGLTDFSTWDILFKPCTAPAHPDASFSATWHNNQSWGTGNQYIGNYYPYQGCLEDFNLGSVNGYWILEVRDNYPLDTGFIEDVDLIFCNDSAPDSCVPSDMPALELDFSNSVADDSVYCFGILNNHTGFKWRFDTLYSSFLNPVFPLGAPGVYPLSLKAWNNTDTLYKTVDVVVPVSAVQSPESPGAHISPNPFSTRLTIEMTNGAALEQPIRLFDHLGRIVRQSEFLENSVEFETSDLPAGVYYIDVKTGQGRIIRKAVKI